MLIGSTLLVTALVAPTAAHAAAPTAGHAVAPTPTTTPAPVHCQVPCGIYGDHLRVQLLMEHAATIEKAMVQIEELGKADQPNWNQLVRWISTKEEHAQMIQDQLSQYWLAQRIKAPGAGLAEKEAMMAQRRYMAQLMGNHAMTTSAMKCKQTTEVANVAALRKALENFQGAYFTPEDLEHLKGHKEDADHGKDAEHDHKHEDGDHDH